ncbi:MAG: DEAD/DEAH box helicase [Hyphomicrobium sp.]|uniref:DEAD/DEAH box helicase n=1 Tax=Hyphomicrobium sp. TaxID=82 RepID=UPI0025BCE639|nr:DEAD/DEAH box helicase [Hyphomicrobium sp.]MBX9862879.1 DEAD/DEAH box helicase [Hyphomicrobium sp.]
MTSFNDLRLAEPILKALADEGYTTPTPIQAKAIPPVMEGRDLLGIAQTGTGKTAAFALPILNRLAADPRPAPRKGCRVLVLSPTRELASQIAESFRAYGRHLGVTVAVVFGGVAHRPQIQALSRGVDVLVAAPGRLLDLMDQRCCELSGTEIFVLDEADQMLDLGFVKPIRRIVSTLSHRRQNLFFSATMPTEISGLADELLNNPVKVSVTPVAATADRVRQRVIHIEAGKKRTILVELLANPEMTRTLVFTRTKRGADRVARHLETAGMKAAAIHGNKSQRQREIALEDFKQSRINVLVATDIAARGIDIDLVSHVINYELPEVPEAYVHRIGRTARAGASGIAISLCDVEERDQLRAIERLTRQQIPHEDRRNDPSIVADKTPAHRNDGQPASGHRRGRGDGHGRGDGRGRGEGRDERGARRGGQHQARGDRGHGRPEGRPESAGASRHENRSERHESRPERHENRAERHEGGPARRDHGHAPRATQSRNDHHGDRRPHRASHASDRAPGGESTGSLRDVGFLARPTRRDGEASAKGNGHRGGPSRGHGDRRDQGGFARPARPGSASRGRDAV